MLVLAVDTALAECQAAVVLLQGTGAPLTRGASNAPAAGNAETIVEHVAAAMADADVAAEAIDRVAVTVGPGSFTGVRVGLAFAKGFGAALDRPVMGATTLEALARTFGAASLAVVDARHGAVYASRLDGGFHMHRFGRCTVDEARALAGEDDLPIVGPRSAVEALGRGTAIDRIDLAALAEVAADEPAMRPPTARYMAHVDAAPQTHKSLARA